MNDEDQHLREYRTQTVPLNTLTMAQVQRAISEALVLGARSVSVQDGALTVGRDVLPHEQVIPQATDTPFDFQKLLERVRVLEVPWSPGRKLLHVVHDALELVAANGGPARWVVCADRALPFLSLALPPTTERFFGLDVVEAPLEDIHKLFFIQSPTVSIEQARLVVVVDIGR